MTTKSVANSFGTFLETVQRGDKVEDTHYDHLKLLVLVNGTDSYPTADLFKESGLGLTAFAEAMRTLREAGFINVVDQPGPEVVKLTPIGEQIARLER